MFMTGWMKDFTGPEMMNRANYTRDIRQSSYLVGPRFYQTVSLTVAASKVDGNSISASNTIATTPARYKPHHSEYEKIHIFL